MPSRFHAAVVVFLLFGLILSLCGCSARVPLAKEDASQWADKSKIYIVLADGSEYTVTRPELANSKLRGSFSPNDRQEVELAEIESMSVRKLDKTRTAVLAVWALTAAVVLITLPGDEKSEQPCPT